MGRWPSGAQDRLQSAAIELFAERGYDRTVVAEIAARAGLTERSYYNHFTDKREALFPGQDQFIAELADAVRAAPTERPALDVVADVVAATADWFDDRREAAAVRRRIIDAHVELQEREAAKMDALTDALAVALRERGTSATAATLTAAAAVAAYRLASANWLADADRRPLGWHARAAVDELRRTAHGW